VAGIGNPIEKAAVIVFKVAGIKKAVLEIEEIVKNIVVRMSR